MGFHPRRFMGPSCVKTTAISPFHDLVTGLTHWEWQSFWQMFLALIKKWTGTTTAGNDAPDATTREHSRQTYPASIFCFLFSQVLFSSSFIVAFSVLTDSTSKALCNRHIFFLLFALVLLFKSNNTGDESITERKDAYGAPRFAQNAVSTFTCPSRGKRQ